MQLKPFLILCVIGLIAPVENQQDCLEILWIMEEPPKYVNVKFKMGITIINHAYINSGIIANETQLIIGINENLKIVDPQTETNATKITFYPIKEKQSGNAIFLPLRKGTGIIYLIVYSDNVNCCHEPLHISFQIEDKPLTTKKMTTTPTTTEIPTILPPILVATAIVIIILLTISRKTFKRNIKS